MTLWNEGLVSIITPSYNAEKLIGRTIQSVLDQTFDNWEMIIVDDCSKDSTRSVVAAYAEKDSRIRLVGLEKNNGAPAAPRNIGVQHASGDWIAFLDADDIWHPRKLELQLEAIKSTRARFSCTQMVDFFDDKEIVFESVKTVPQQIVDFSQQRIKGRIPTSSVLLDKELIMEFPFNVDMRYKAVEDYHCWLRILSSETKCLKLNAPLLYYRRVVGQISGSKKYMLERMFMLLREYPGGSILKATLYTLTHALGGFYYRILRKGL
ncbi:glycosyltransferase family 2 protein [Pseudomonas aeruginosa]|uniref:glycosyltransferase family 2 protein n=1 Tax=Pseudomonas aeruginosa TaxID=287 RepID=UPI00292C66F2|nr:glycosyltransferase family 2 protein [Pseudomonas aeruginosa]